MWRGAHLDLNAQHCQNWSTAGRRLGCSLLLTGRRCVAEVHRWPICCSTLPSEGMITMAEEKNGPQVKGLYVIAFTPDELAPEPLKAIVQVADRMLRAKDAVFKHLMEEGMAPQTRIEIVNMQHVPLMHTPQGMQTTLAGWLKARYSLPYQPVLGKNFFPHGMRDPQGKETYVLFYFDMSQ
jgi:hypothetical protein